MTQHTQFAAAYTKALVHHPKAVVADNIERAFKECPMYDAAPDMLAALKLALSKDMLSGDVADNAREAIAKAEGK